MVKASHLVSERVNHEVAEQHRMNGYDCEPPFVRDLRSDVVPVRRKVGDGKGKDG